MHARAAIGSACCLSLKVKGIWPHALVACEGFEKLKWRPQFMQGPMEPEQHGEEQKDVGIIFSSSPKIMGRIITFLGGEHVPDVQEVQAFVRASEDIWLEFAIYNSRRKEKEKQRQEEERGMCSRCRGRTESEEKFRLQLAQEHEAIEEEWRSRNQCFTCDSVASEGPCDGCGALVCWSCSNQSSVYVQQGLWGRGREVLCLRCTPPEANFPPGFHDRLAGKR